MEEKNTKSKRDAVISQTGMARFFWAWFNHKDILSLSKLIGHDSDFMKKEAGTSNLPCKLFFFLPPCLDFVMFFSLLLEETQTIGFLNLLSRS